jgi:transposase
VGAKGTDVAYNFIPCDRDQSFLMPPSLRDWLPPDHLVWFVIDAVAQMDLSAFRGKYRADGWGASAFSPDMMVTLLLYAYCTGQRSSRKIETLCERDVAFRIVTGNTKPDHATIARFRRNNLKELEGLFVQILRLCAEAGLVKVGVVALDGTKVAGNAALSANRTHEGLEKEIAREAAKMLAEAESTDAEEDRRHGSKRGDEMPEELRTQKSRIERLRECKERLEREAAERAAEQQKKIDERAAKEAETGQMLRGRKPKERMDRKLLTKRARALYRLRSQTVEPVFGQIKNVRGIDRFLLRGLDGASGEWKLACGTHNLIKLWRSGRAKWN